MNTTDVYSSHSTNWPVVALSVALAAPLAAFARPAGGAASLYAWDPSLLALLIVMFISVLTATSLRVTIGRSDVTARFGALRVPRFRYPVTTLAGARSATIAPWATPGIWWTHRDGLRLALRGGPAVRLTLASGRRVTIGVDDSASALRALRQAGVPDVG